MIHTLAKLCLPNMGRFARIMGPVLAFPGLIHTLLLEPYRKGHRISVCYTEGRFHIPGLSKELCIHSQAQCHICAIVTSRVSDAVEVIESEPSVCPSVCVSVSALTVHLWSVCVDPSWQKVHWGEGTSQHGSREVRQRSGVFIF